MSHVPPPFKGGDGTRRWWVGMKKEIPLSREEYLALVRDDAAARQFWAELGQAFGPLEFVEAWRCDDADEKAPTGS